MTEHEKTYKGQNFASLTEGKVMPAPKWIIEMKEYYANTGYYRAEDVERLLGDPRVAVTLELEDQIENPFIKPKKSGKFKAKLKYMGQGKPPPDVDPH